MQILFDPHVHYYPIFSSKKFWNSAYSNFEQSKATNSDIACYAICLTERNDCNFYAEISTLKKILDIKILSNDGHLILIKESKLPLHIFPGRQVNSLEGLEVLGLFYKNPLPEKTPVLELIKTIKESAGIPVINWAPGKWLGARGKILIELLPQLDKDIALGLTSLLPHSFKFPNLVLEEIRTKNRLVILGSDPLPLTGEEKLVGSCGLKLEITDLSPESFKTALSSHKVLEYYGKRDSLLNIAIRIIRNEIKRRT